MISFDISAERVNVDLENQTVIVTGVDESELVSEIGVEQLLDAMEFSDVHNYVIQRLSEDDDE